MTQQNNAFKPRFLIINFAIDVVFAMALIIALVITIYRSLHQNGLYLLALMSVLLIVSVLCILTFIVILFLELYHKDHYIEGQNSILQVGVALYNLVLLIISIKYLTISIKMSLHKDVDNTLYDKFISIMYKTLAILNVVFPVLTGVFVDLYLPDRTKHIYEVLRKVCSSITFILQIITCVILIIAVYKIRQVLRGKNTVVFVN